MVSFNGVFALRCCVLGEELRSPGKLKFVGLDFRPRFQGCGVLLQASRLFYGVLSLCFNIF